MSYQCGSRKCDLCRAEKVAIALFEGVGLLKVQISKLYNNKYMITLIQITNTEIFAFISVLVLKLLSRKVLFTKRKRL